jgi:hypothetical protein
MYPAHINAVMKKISIDTLGCTRGPFMKSNYVEGRTETQIPVSACNGVPISERLCHRLCSRRTECCKEDQIELRSG